MIIEKNKEYSPDDPLFGFAFVSDGFFLNLNIILLQLARPFAEAYSPKLLKINPVYCISRTAHVHLKGNYTDYRKNRLLAFRMCRIVQSETDDSPPGGNRAEFGRNFQFYNWKFFHGTFKLFIFNQSTSSNIGKGTFSSPQKEPSRNMTFP